MTKRSKRKNRLLLWLGCLAAYGAMLLLLLAAERSDPNASIRTLGDAFWYSLVTVSTVGYGDFYPVTAVGRVLGGCFVILSVGVLTFLISSMLALLTGKLLPSVQLWLLRSRPWYVFSCGNSAVVALAEDLAARHPEAVFLFAAREDVPGGFAGKSVVYPGSPEQLVCRWKGKCTLILMNEGENTYEEAVELAPRCEKVCCMTQYMPDRIPEGVVLFDRYDCCAQAYWQNHPLQVREQTLLIVGDGSYARKLLERGLLQNVFGPERKVDYHVFGDWTDFQREHPGLHQTVSVNGAAEQADGLFYHEIPWNGDAALLANADRILICQDDKQQNLEILRKLRMYFPTRASIYIRSDSAIPSEQVFGTNREIFTEELVLQALQTRAARRLHQIYLDSTGAQSPAWEELSGFLRMSNVAAADHLLTKVRLLLEDADVRAVTAETCEAAYRRYVCLEADREWFRRVEHQRWTRFHSLYNWRYAPKRDNALRHHPMMRPFGELSQDERSKDDYAWQLLGQIFETE